jgi:hypothetical protein
MVEIFLTGFLFLFILATFFASAAFGNKLGFDFDPDDMLQKINNDPTKLSYRLLGSVEMLLRRFTIH